MISQDEQIKLSFFLENCRKDASYVIIFTLSKLEEFETEKVKCKNNKSTLKFSNSYFCYYNFSTIQKIKITIQRWKNISSFINFKIPESPDLTLSAIVSSKNSRYELKVNKNDSDSEKIIIVAENPNYSENQEDDNNFTFFDYINAGIEFYGFIGIDFSNGEEHTEKLESNQYLQSIKGFTETLYSFITSYEVYGFGAEMKDSNDNLLCQV